MSELQKIIDKIPIKPYFSTPNGVLYNCDCLSVMKHIPENSIDLVLTDPPYGINMSTKIKQSRGFRGAKTKQIDVRGYSDKWDNIRPNKTIFNNILKISKESIIFGGNYFADLLPISTHWLVWDKLNTMPTFSDCELAYTTSKRKSVKKYTVEYNGLIGQKDIRQHPTQKPVLIISKILQDYSKENDLIADLYLGSGTTAVACEQLGRQWLACEISESYCAIAKERIENESNQGKFDFGVSDSANDTGRGSQSSLFDK